MATLAEYDRDLKGLVSATVDSILSLANPLQAIAGQINSLLLRDELYKAKKHAIDIAYRLGKITLSQKSLLTAELAGEQILATEELGYGLTPAVAVLIGPLSLGISHLLGSYDRDRYRRERNKWISRFEDSLRKAYEQAAEIEAEVHEYVRLEDGLNLQQRIDRLTSILGKMEIGGGDVQRILDLTAYRMSLEGPVLLELYSGIKQGLLGHEGAIESGGQETTRGYMTAAAIFLGIAIVWGLS